jgi:hypothetical protein
MDAVSVGAVFSRAWSLLRVNLAIVVPGLLVGALIGFVSAYLAPPLAVDDVTGGLSRPYDRIARLLVTTISVIASVLTISFTTGMARSAWENGRATFSDGSRAFRNDAGNVLVALGLLFVLGFLASLLAPFTLFVSLLAYVFFCIYTMPSVIVGERNGFASVVESAAIAWRRPLTTGLLVGGLAAIMLAMSAVASVLSAAPFVGQVISNVVLQVVVAYFTLVIVGEYLTIAGEGSLAT